MFTKEEKEILIKDLCARLPYGVKCLVNYTFCNETTDYEDVKSFTVDTLMIINQQTESYFFEWLCEWFDIDEFKPYLFPLSSMTDEQYEDFIIVSGLDGDIEDIRRGKFSCVGTIGIDYIYDTLDWLNKNHFDYRGLIEMGLAEDASKLNIY